MLGSDTFWHHAVVTCTLMATHFTVHAPVPVAVAVGELVVGVGEEETVEEALVLVLAVLLTLEVLLVVLEALLVLVEEEEALDVEEEEVALVDVEEVVGVGEGEETGAEEVAAVVVGGATPPQIAR